MHEKLSRHFDLAANVAIVVIALLLAFSFVQQYLRSDSKTPSREALVGKPLSVPGVDWRRRERTLVFVLSSKCHFCTESAPFYRDLIANSANQPDLQMIAVLTDPVDTAKQYLGSLSIPLEPIHIPRLKAINVAGSPALLIVDSKGIVKYAWTGKLDARAEQEVRKRLNESASRV